MEAAQPLWAMCATAWLPLKGESSLYMNLMKLYESNKMYVSNV